MGKGKKAKSAQATAKKSNKKKPKKKQDTRKDCSRCNRGAGEEFQCMKKRYLFDVDLARDIVADGREALELERDDVEFSVGRCQINEQHLAHVDPSIPGIMAHVYFPDDGRLVHGHRLIDGHHRAARCLQLEIPFLVRVLSEQESVRILMKAPKGARPDAEALERLAEAQESPVALG